ncbi:MAG: CBS domain containing protein [Candidatus Methanohalarchaeum thermophilum]|uniref:CBS domain containing protein n=1 Tax=Methanohalarchaeum thermophilum TaxID=1903181 RepID=A0A1Q6DV34_METT1|nr:MAG: CBS domain containing protein [Candidatus Methanohalarchaeum thermophilum]
MKCGKIMDKDPLTLKENEFITHARQVLRDNKLRSVPVLDEDEKLVGVLTRRGVLNVTSNKSNVTVQGYVKKTTIVTPETELIELGHKMIQSNQGTLPVVESPRNEKVVGIVNIVDLFNSIEKLDISTNEKSEDIMTKKVETLSSNDRVTKAWTRMTKTGYSGFPILKDNNLVGIVTRLDILKSGFARFKKEDDGSRRVNDSPKVEKIMSTPVFKVKPSTNVTESAKIMREKDIGRLPVVDSDDEKRLIGIIDRYDILESLLGA